MCRYEAGDLEEARALLERHLPLIQAHGSIELERIASSYLCRIYGAEGNVYKGYAVYFSRMGPVQTPMGASTKEPMWASQVSRIFLVFWVMSMASASESPRFWRWSLKGTETVPLASAFLCRKTR